MIFNDEHNADQTSQASTLIGRYSATNSTSRSRDGTRYVAADYLASE
jgi:hypothetical protein